jgi:hypothetical protein
MRDGQFQLLGAPAPRVAAQAIPQTPAAAGHPRPPAGLSANLAGLADAQGRVFAQGAGDDAFFRALFGAQPNESAFISVVPAAVPEPMPPNHPVPTACFAAGTRILTLNGEVAVEDLAVGDQVVLAEGSPAAIIWIGYRDLAFARHPAPETVRPVRIKPGALAMGVPHRELSLSPDHALYFDGALVQAKDLVDGAVITQDWQVASARYFHVELASHGILLAEGAPAESYLDTGHRGIYANSAEPLILHPDLMQRRREAESVAPLVTGGPELAAIRTRLHARNMMLGLTLADAPYLGLVIAGTLLAPAEIAGERFTFTLPPATRDAVLATPVFVPAQVDPASNDRRALGVAITEILADGRSVPVASIIDKGDLHYQGRDPSVWTRGAARLTIPDGTSTLTFCLAAAPRLWQRRQAA